MDKLWNWVDYKALSRDGKVRIFLCLNCLKYGFLGFVAWLLVSRIALGTVDWAICFVGYPGFFVGYLGGILYLCQKH